MKTKQAEGKKIELTKMEYGHWGITVSTRAKPDDYAPIKTKFFAYPIGARGPINDSNAEREAITYCRALNGEVKGPFFSVELYDTHAYGD